MPIDLILGTAGHIDHGKTALVRALTGVDHGSSAGGKTPRDHDRPGVCRTGSGRLPVGSRGCAGPRAVREEHAGRGHGHGRGPAGRRGRRFGQAADPRASGDPAAAGLARRGDRADQVRPGGTGLGGSGGSRGPRPGDGHVSGGCAPRCGPASRPARVWTNCGGSWAWQQRKRRKIRGGGRDAGPVSLADRSRVHRGRSRHGRHGQRQPAAGPNSATNWCWNLAACRFACGAYRITTGRSRKSIAGSGRR